MYVVKDGQRQLKFNGDKLSESSSRTYGRTRWVEFQLYRTEGGQYVLARVGVSLYYHATGCTVIKRNRLSPVPTEEVSTAMLPCEACSPVPMDEDVLYPEEPRYWAQIADSADAVVKSLHKVDADGVKYLTNVSRRLLADAAKIDEDISDAYYVQKVV